MSEITTETPAVTVDTAQALSAVVAAAEVPETAATPEALAQETASEGAEKSKELEEPKKLEDAPKDEKFASKFAAISRQEKRLKEQERTFKASMAAKERELADKAANIGKDMIPRARIKQEALEVLKEEGITLQMLADMILNDGKPTQDMVFNQKEKEIRDEIASLRKEREEEKRLAQEEKNSQALHAFKTEISDYTKNNPEYELIRANDASELVYEVIEQHHSETGEILDIKKAADAVEEHLLDDAVKHVNVEKVKKKMAPQEPKKQEAPKVQASKTLTNADSTAAATPKKVHLSDEESKAEAAKLLKWT